MRVERFIYSILILGAVIYGALSAKRAALFQADNEQLRAHIAELESIESQAAQISETARTSAEKVRAQNNELQKLRGEVTQLRGSSKTSETLAAENQRLQAELQRLRTAAGSQPAQAPSGGLPGHDQFPRDSWSFAGYSSPESALVSAIFAMKQGDPKAYLESLSPEEQQRMAQTWQNKSENEIAEKHKSDVSAIAGLRVLERQNISPSEVVMNVYLEGPGRIEKIRMNQVGQEWKFGGIIRDPQRPAQ